MDSSNKRPSIGATLLLIVGVVPFMAGLFGLYHLLGVGMAYVGFLFLVYWAAILHQDPKAFLPSVLGGVGGILLAWLLIAMPPLVGQAGTVIAFAALVAVLFCFMRGHARLVVNNSTMLFLTVATIPDLKIASNVVVMAESLLLAAAYMGAVSGVVHLVTKHRSKKSPAPAPI
ncbi:hypothetical protein LJR225_002295 [Phenylobacterium sp. LjRoot225]|uniref:hypothetical protein n=1 Tax=Phenylobacterium sp. LjRoot225 TaxID=3342285 RepID=UPI003ED11B23